MTDELSIQMEPQVKHSSALPYALGGAVIGAGAGAFSPIGVTKPKYESFDDILKESEDTFTKEIAKNGENKSVWENAKQQVEKVKNAEAEYDKKVEAIKKEFSTPASALPDDNEAKKKLTSAEEALSKQKETIANSDEYKKWIKDAETKLSSEGSATTTTTKFKLPKPDDVQSLGKKVSLKEVKEYETLYNNYQTALEASKKNADRTALKAFKGNVGDTLDGLYNIRKKNKKGFSIITKKNAIENRVNILKNDIATMLPKISDPKRIAHEMKAAGVDYKPGSKNYNKFVQKLNESVLEERKQMLNEILGEKVQVDVIDSKTKKVTGKRNSYKNVEAYHNLQQAKENAKAKFEKRTELKQIGGLSNLDTVENYDKALKNLEKNKGKMTVSAYDRELKRLQTGRKLANEYKQIMDGLDNRLESFFDRISHTKKMKTKIENSIHNEAKVQSALAKLKNFSDKNDAIKNIAFETVENKGTQLSKEEISKKAVEMVEGDSKYLNKLKPYQDAVETAKKEADEAAKKLGVTAKELTGDELAKVLKDKGIAATKAEYTAEIKKAAKEALEKDLGKLKTPNRVMNAVIAGAALALVGLGIGAAKKN